MRVNYTLPALFPVDEAPAEPARTRISPFRARLSLLPSPRWLDWRTLLRVEEPPVNAATIGPPPRPATFESADAASHRLAWRQMLDRQVNAFDPGGDVSRADTQAIERMLTLL